MEEKSRSRSLGSCYTDRVAQISEAGEIPPHDTQQASPPTGASGSQVPVRSFAKLNRQLLEDFENYLIALNRSAATRRSYLDSVGRLIEMLGSKNVADLDRGDIRKLQGQLLARGVHANSLELHTAGIRVFSKFIRLLGLTKHDPCLLLSHRKLPSRLPRVLTLEEIDKLIAACETPLERAVIEVLYSTGVRISELVALRVDDITFSEPGVIRVHRGKGDKDRIVLFGRPARAAIEKYLNGRTAGFLFEAPARVGYVTSNRFSWLGRFYVDGVQQTITLGKLDSMSASEVRKMLQDTLAETPGFNPHPAGPYNARSIRLLVNRVAFRAGVRGVHPHAFRRACALHLLEGGADLRVIQDLLGHKFLSTTCRYTPLSAANLKQIHDQCHPHAKETENVEEK